MLVGCLFFAPLLHFLRSRSLLKNKMFNLSSINVNKERYPSVNILALDGGGMRGIFILSILKHLSKALYQDSGVYGTTQLVSKFGLICGTSTGSIIAVALASGKSIDQIMEFYYTFGDKIFSGNKYIYAPFRYFRYYRTGDYYDGNILYDTIKGSYCSGELPKPFNEISGKKSSKLFITCTNATTNNWEPFLIRTYKDGSDIKGSTEIDVPTAIRASCAAPTYFSPVVKEGKVLIDGGCVCNNPSELALIEGFKLWEHGVKNLVSIGTGLPNGTKGRLSLSDIVTDFIDVATSSELIHSRVQEWCKINKIEYYRFNTPGLNIIKLNEGNKFILENGEIITENYMKSIQEVVKHFADKL